MQFVDFILDLKKRGVEIEHPQVPRPYESPEDRDYIYVRREGDRVWRVPFPSTRMNAEISEAQADQILRRLGFSGPS